MIKTKTVKIRFVIFNAFTVWLLYGDLFFHPNKSQGAAVRKIVVGVIVDIFDVNFKFLFAKLTSPVKYGVTEDGSLLHQIPLYYKGFGYTLGVIRSYTVYIRLLPPAIIVYLRSPSPLPEGGYFA